MEVVLQKISESSQLTISRVDCAVDFTAQAPYKVIALEDGFEWIVQADDSSGTYMVLMKHDGEEVFDAGLHLRANSSIMFSCNGQFFRVYIGRGV